MKVKNKKAFGFGILLLSIGLIILFYYNVPVWKEKVRGWKVVKGGVAVKQYNVTGFFIGKNATYCEKMHLKLPSSFRENYIPLPFNVSIICPDNSTVVFEVEFLGDIYHTIYYYHLCNIFLFLFYQTNNYQFLSIAHTRYYYGHCRKLEMFLASCCQ